MASKQTNSRSDGAGRSKTITAKCHARTRDDHALEVAEDYVELIDDLIRNQGEARGVDLAAHLGVSPVTVSKTVARLKREGLVTAEPYRAIFLTRDGKLLAEKARARHTLVLAFLVALGVPEKVADADAEGVEHHLSPATLTAMKRFLGQAG